METLNVVLFYALVAMTAVSAVAVVVTQNIVRAATWLLFTLAGIAGVFFLLGADFMGATQLLIYVGGTLVLVVFGVMLTAQGPFINMRISAAEWAISLAVGLVLFGLLTVSLISTPAPIVPRSLDADSSGKILKGFERDSPGMLASKYLGASLLGDDRVTPSADISGMPAGSKLHQRSKITYLLPFEVVSIHLLVVLIGAAYLARAKRRRGAQS